MELNFTLKVIFLSLIEVFLDTNLIKKLLFFGAYPIFFFYYYPFSFYLHRNLNTLFRKRGKITHSYVYTKSFTTAYNKRCRYYKIIFDK